jgi:hypothetical protein
VGVFRWTTQMVVRMVVRPIAKLSERARYNEPLVMELSMLRRRASNHLAAIWRKRCAAML